MRELGEDKKKGANGKHGAGKSENTAEEQTKRKMTFKKVFHYNRRKLFGSIRTKLVGFFMIPMVLIIILGMVSYSKSSTGLIQSYETSTISNLNNVTNYLEFGFNSVSSKASMLNSNNIFQRYYSGFYKDDKSDEQKQYTTVQSLVASNVLMEPYVSDIFIFGNYGKGIGITEDGSGTQDFYTKFMETGEGLDFIETGDKNRWLGYHPFLDENTLNESSDYSISYISYIYNSSSKPNGFVILDVTSEFVNKALEESGLSESGIIAFITSDGRELVQGEIPEKFTFLEQNYYKEAHDGIESSGYEYIDFNGADYMFVYSKVEASDSLLCALIPKADIIKKANEVKNITILIIIIACIIAILSGTIMASGISNVIRTTIKVLNQTAEGDLTVTLKVKRKDEFNILGESINNMINSMQSLIKKMAGVSNTVSHSAIDVSDNSVLLLQATQNITTSVNEIEQGIIQQAEDAQRCLTDMSALVDQINLISENTNHIKRTADNTKDIVEKGFTIIDDLSNKAADTSNITHTVIENIENLDIESRSISGIIKTINDIATQTNLLSLNASIEAARAGEFGKGFSVVADEIRKLAEQSALATNQISKIINQIQGHTKQTVEAAKQAEKIVTSQESALQSTVHLFNEIKVHVGGLAENLLEITDGITKIEHAKEDTLGAIESISAISQETASSASELGIIIENQLKSVEILNKAAIRLGEDAINLEETVSVFKIKLL